MEHGPQGWGWDSREEIQGRCETLVYTECIGMRRICRCWKGPDHKGSCDPGEEFSLYSEPEAGVGCV